MAILYDYFTSNQLIRLEDNSNLTIEQIASIWNSNSEILCKSFDPISKQFNSSKIVKLLKVQKNILNQQFEIGINAFNLLNKINVSANAQILTQNLVNIQISDLNNSHQIFSLYKVLKYALNLNSEYKENFIFKPLEIKTIIENNTNNYYYIELENKGNLLINNCCYIKLSYKVINEPAPILQQS